jgi:hypothetical protein
MSKVKIISGVGFVLYIEVMILRFAGFVSSSDFAFATWFFTVVLAYQLGWCSGHIDRSLSGTKEKAN